MAAPRGADAPVLRPIRRFAGMLPDRPTLAACALIALVAAIAYRDFLRLDKLFLFTDMGADTVNGQYPLLVHWAETLREGRLPGWTFGMGMGQNLWPGALGNPFDLALMALGRDRLPYGFAYMEVLKIVLAGGLFFAVLRSLKLALPAATAGALLYAFSGFMILGGSWYTFSTEGVYLALLLLAFERHFQRGRWGLLVLAFALIAAGRPFNLFSNGLLLAAYASVRFVHARGWAPRAHLGLIARLAGLGAVGAAISGVLLLPALNEMLTSYRVEGVAAESTRARLLGHPVFGPAGALHYKTAVLRLFSNDLLGRGSDFRGWKEYLDAPLYYVGLPTLLLAPQLLALVGRRRRLVLLGLVALAAVPAVFPSFRYVLWLYAADYYRIVGFMLALVPLFLALAALSRLAEGARANLPLLGGTLAVLLALLYAPLPPTDVPLEGDVRLWVTGLLAAYAAVIALLGRARWHRLAGPVLVGLICLEALIVATPAATARPVVTAADLNAKTGYNDYSADAVAWIRATDPGLYRVEKTFTSSPSDYIIYRNDALVQGYRGTAGYHRFSNPAYIRFLVAVGTTEMLAETEYRVTLGLAARAFLQPLVGVRYLITRAPNLEALAAGLRIEPEAASALYTPVRRFGDVTVFKARYALPLAFTYDRFMDHRSFLALPREVREKALYYAFVADPRYPEALKGLDRFDPAQPGAPFPAALAERAAGGLAIDRYGPEHIRGTIRVARQSMLCFTIPDDPGWSAEVDGRPATLRLVNFGFMGVVLEPGAHTVELRYRPPLRRAGAALSGGGLVVLAGLLLVGSRPRRGRRGA